MLRYILVPKKGKDSVELTNAIRKQNKKNKNSGAIYSSVVVDMSNPEAVKRNFSKTVSENDIIEIHAEGTPWDIGTETYSEYDFSPFALVQFFNEHLPEKDFKIAIELHACNSGTIANGPDGEICFARDFSSALHSFGITNVTVVGYAGFVQSERVLKQSVVSEPVKHGAKVSHCTLEEATVVYQNGTLKQIPEKRLVDYAYSEEDTKEDFGLIRYFKDKFEFELNSLNMKIERSNLNDLGLDEEASLLLRPMIPVKESKIENGASPSNECPSESKKEVGMTTTASYRNI